MSGLESIKKFLKNTDTRYSRLAVESGEGGIHPQETRPITPGDRRDGGQKKSPPAQTSQASAGEKESETNRDNGTRYSRLAMENGEEDFDQEAWDRAGVKAKELVAKLYEELNHPFRPSNYDPNNPADRAAWERAGVKAKKCMEEICWSGPYSCLANMQSGSAGEKPAAETSSRASGTSWNPGGGFGSDSGSFGSGGGFGSDRGKFGQGGGFGGNAEDSVDTGPNMTENGKAEGGATQASAGESAKDYLQKSLNQLLLGNYTDDVTLLGTAGQVMMGIAGVDAGADIRDLTYDLTHWEETPGRQKLLDALGLLPGIGAVKNVDEMTALVKGLLGSASATSDLKKILGSAEALKSLDGQVGLAKVIGSMDAASEALKGFLRGADKADTIGKDIVGNGNLGSALESAVKNANESSDAIASADKAIRTAAEGAGKTPQFKSWDDFSGYIQDVGKDTSLTIAEKVQKIQWAYNGIADKTDINIPISDKYVKGFDENGTIIYDWPKYLGFDTKKPIEPITRDNMMPETWDRYGSMKGSNFADISASGRYSNSERSIPYVKNEKAYHSGKFNNATYFDKMDAIKSGDLEALNEILESEGIPTVSESYFMELMDKYNDSIAKITKEIGINVDGTYGLKGKAAAWGDLEGGARQIVTPLIGKILSRLGIIY